MQAPDGHDLDGFPRRAGAQSEGGDLSHGASP
jgi:hypothetical protein